MILYLCSCLADMVAVFGETTGSLAFRELHRIMSNDPEGRQILRLDSSTVSPHLTPFSLYVCAVWNGFELILPYRDRPRINTSTLDLDYLRQLPKETFGHAYYRFLADNVSAPSLASYSHHRMETLGHLFGLAQLPACAQCLLSCFGCACTLDAQEACYQR